MVTAGTYRKEPLFRTPERRDLLQTRMFKLAKRYKWKLQAWAILNNHYHFIAIPEDKPDNLPVLIKALHAHTATAVNREDAKPGRKVWFQYWDSHLTYPRSYFARLNYVHHNPVHHGLVASAENYEWCSARRFKATTRPSFVRMIAGFKHDRIRVPDDFQWGYRQNTQAGPTKSKKRQLRGRTPKRSQPHE